MEENNSSKVKQFTSVEEEDAIQWLKVSDVKNHLK